jgi:2-polyprenyl-3-methyl-5-hydroxy-6-metoxy-1,4-benzoquinol methylase
MAEQLERLWVSKLGTLERGRLLEIGAGTGFFELVALARGWEVEGIELSEGAVEFARKYMHVPIKQSTIEEYTSSHLFDAIVMIEVLEHFRDPLEAIRSLKKLSTGHTLIFGTTPNTDSKHWLTSQQNIYVPEDHLFLFNTKSLQLFADKAGIYDVSIEYFGSGENNDSNLMFAGIISS